MSPDLALRGAAIIYASERDPDFEVQFPAELKNTTNGGGGRWRHVAGIKAKRAAAFCACRKLELPEGERLIVLITRIGPRRLDDDGATTSGKPIQDGIADALGINDRDPRVTWLPVDQAKGGVREYGCRIEAWRWVR
jgi:hypothetical protein